jgi:hypothetical protein
MSEHRLKISIFKGDYLDDVAELTHVYDLEGSAIPGDWPPSSPLEEAHRVLEMCAEKYAAPHLNRRCFTVFFGRKIGTNVSPLVRPDCYARNGVASAGVIGLPPGWHTEPVTYWPDDSAVGIVRKILALLTPR